MKHLIAWCIDTLFPPHPDVVKARAVPAEELCAGCTIRLDKKRRVYSALSYAKESVRALIRANKYYADPHAARLLSEVLGIIIETVLDERALDSSWRRPLVVPMPASPKRLRERGYNQVAHIVEHLPLPGNFERSDALKRRHRESQTRVVKSKRAKNIAGAFYVPENAFHEVVGRSILLIDDVCESGSTMKDATRALKEAGAREIVGIALAT